MSARSPGSILVVDDDTNILEVLHARLAAAGFSVITASDGPSAIEELQSHPVDLLISDMKMPEMNGMDLLEEARRLYPALPVIFLTAYGTIPDAVKAVKAGAVDYISKPFDGKALVEKVNEVLDLPRAEETTFKAELDEGFYWGTSEPMQDLKRLIDKVAASNANVLILGESGVGKECIAKAIHHKSQRRSRPYVVVDCGSTPPGILESELFGHMKGSFTNAVSDKKGLIEAADGGTLFLDEIGNISAEMQARLLRFLEEKKIRKVGAIKETAVDCRVISATNSDLSADIKEGRFRNDLYYRLRVVTVHVPPLRERREDIPELARLFADLHCREQNIQQVELPKETIDWLVNYDWPGNVRELKNALEAGVVLCRENIMYPEDLQLIALEEETSEEEKLGNFSIKSSERDAIIRALKEAGGVQTRAAELLDISRRSIHYKIKKYKIEVDNYKG